MERITTLLEKIRELNSKPSAGIIEIDLMMDYTKVLYADLIEWRSKVAFTSAVTFKENESGDAAAVLEDNQSVVKKSEIAGPAVELDNTAINYESKPEKKTTNALFSEPQYSNADIRQHIGINDKYQFISELFGNNKDAYEEVISEINTFDTEEETIAWINNSISTQLNWKDDSEAVQAFYKLLSDFFASR